MKLWFNPIGFEHAKKLIANPKVDFVIVGLKDELSTRNTCLLTIDQIKQIVCDKLVVSLNNLYTDDQIALLESCLKQLKEINVKTIVFTDFAVKQICDEINYDCELVYASETLATNYGQFDFYAKNNINEIGLARELNFLEIKTLAQNKQTLKLQMQAEGYGLLMHSKWMLLTNFAKQFNIKQDLTNQMFILKEETRELPNLIYEDNTGTHMFSGYNISVMEYLDQLVEIGIDSLNFFSFFHDEKWVDKNIEIYSSALEDIKLNKFNETKDKHIEELKKINKISACGFLDFSKGLLHLEREVK